MSKGRILVVDDDDELIQLVRYTLEREGYEVLGASNGDAGLAAAMNHKPNLVLLDRAMPGLDGLEVCRRLRNQGPTAYLPIILLTARATEDERVAGLEAGADDYMTKPFSTRELVARVRAILRRVGFRPRASEVLRVGNLVIDVSRHLVTCRDQKVELTAAEFRILRFMALAGGRVLSRSEIIEGALNGHVDGLSRTIDVHLASIRRKLGPGASMLLTIRGVGYRLADEKAVTQAGRH